MAPFTREINEDEFIEIENENNFNNQITVELRHFIGMYEQGAENDGIFVYQSVPGHLNLQDDYSDASSSDCEFEEENGFDQIDPDVIDRALQQYGRYFDEDIGEYVSDDVSDVIASKHNSDGEADVSASEYESDGDTDVSASEYESDGDTDVSASKYESDGDTDVSASKYESDGDTDVSASEYESDGDTDVSASEYESDGDTEDEYSKIDPNVQDELSRNVREY